MRSDVVCVATRVENELRCQVDLNPVASYGSVAFLFAIFCAWWAINSGRNAWLWFFFALIAAPISGLILLYKTSQARTGKT